MKPLQRTLRQLLAVTLPILKNHQHGQQRRQCGLLLEDRVLTEGAGPGPELKGLPYPGLTRGRSESGEGDRVIFIFM